MRTLLLTGLLLVAAAAAAVPTASAQQQGVLIIELAPPTELLTNEGTLVLSGVARLTVDVTAYAATAGIPVAYSVVTPEWASAIITPASDVFQFSTVPTGFTATSTRPITIMVSATELEEDITGTLSVHGATAPASPGGQSFYGRADTIIAYDAPDEPEEPCTVLTDEQKAALLAEGAAMYNSYQEQQDAPSARDEGDVSVQNTGATLMPSPWVGVAAFGLVGAGVGLFLRRKLRA